MTRSRHYLRTLIALATALNMQVEELVEQSLATIPP